MHKHIHRVHIKIVILFLVLAIILVGGNFVVESRFQTQPVTYGVSFSPNYATYIGEDPKDIYQKILYDLRAKVIRINAYWDLVEPNKDQFDFKDLDYYITEAEGAGATIILTVGYKLPRWPECRAPKWVDSSDLKLRQERQLSMVKQVIERYEQNPTVSAFQIENEPLLKFGECPEPDVKFLEKEVSLVRTLTKKPIILTDSGELRTWATPMKLSDVFGTTIYRKVFDHRIGELYYPIPPSFYRLKSEIIRKTLAPKNQKTIVAELQAEVWTDKALPTVPIETQVMNYPLRDLKATVNFTKKTGFSEVILWGAEWWYYMAKRGHPEYLEYTKSLF